MSSVWRDRKFRNIKKISTRLSPKHNKNINIIPLSPARGLPQSPFKEGTSKGTFKSSMERTSPFTFFSKISASMTVEAAIVLPLFLFFFINLSCALEMIRLHGNLELALWETGNRMSVYGHILSNQTDERADSVDQDESRILREAEDLAFSYIYVKDQVIRYTGEDYLNQSPLLYGTAGLQFAESDIFTSEDHFEIIMTYVVSPWIKMEGIRSFRMANRYYGHVWNGYKIPGTDTGRDSFRQLVYVTENGKVYHENRNCTHLKLTIKEVNKLQAAYERNENGGRYTLCEKCGKGSVPENVYICAEGDKYHYSRECPGLKRTVYSISKDEAGKYRPCSRCSVH